MTIPMVVLGFGSGGGIIRHITSNAQEYNLFTSIGSPTGPVNIQLIVDAGVYVWSDNVLVPALDFGPLPAGSKVKLTNLGFIMGRGGNGANAGNVLIAAQNGGNAINATCEITIDNIAGYILAGGGGGGGIANLGQIGGGNPGPFVCGGGGAAGGGRGGSSNSGDSGGMLGGGLGGAIGLKGADGVIFGSFIGTCSAAGGGRLAVGTGGVGAFTFDTGAAPTKAFGGECGGGGGAVCDESNSHGGTGGANTTNGGNGVREGGTNENAGGGGGGWGMPGGIAVKESGLATVQVPGVGGKAVNLNGNTIIWLAGSASPRVQGAVS